MKSKTVAITYNVTIVHTIVVDVDDDFTNDQTVEYVIDNPETQSESREYMVTAIDNIMNLDVYEYDVTDIGIGGDV